jgi:hypothetical protein
MSTKPSIVTTWATDAAYVGGTYDGETNKATPGATLIAQGYEPNVKPTAQNLNQRLNAIGTWLQYLNDGAFEGASTFNSTLGVTGAVLMSSTLGVTGLITATAGVTCAANQHITQSGTGEHKHGDRPLHLPGCAGVAASGIAYSTTNGSISTTASTTVFYSWALKKGDRPKSVTFARSGDGAVDFTAINVVLANSSTAGQTSLGSTTLTDVGASADTTIALTSSALADYESVFMYFTINAAAAVIENVRLTIDHP